MRAYLPLIALLASPSLIWAQAERYELGQRLKRFEQAWNAVEDRSLRDQALRDLPKLTTQFFSFQFGEAGRTLDEAESLLLQQKRTSTQQYLRALYPVPESCLVDADQPMVKFSFKPFYPVKLERTPEVLVQLRWQASDPEAAWEQRVSQWPLREAIPFPKLRDTPADWGADYLADIRFAQGEDHAHSQIMVSRVKSLSARLAELKMPFNGLTIESATLKERHDQLSLLAEGGFIPETNLPAAQLLREAETIRQLGAKPYFTSERSGQFWLSVPTGKNRSTACRLFVPEKLSQDKPVPMVVALHGAGGSENLFFEGYGAGQIVAECQKRGWLLLATRSGLGFGTAPPLPAILDQLAERYPIDRKRVFLVGHSMGAGQAVAASQEFAGQFRAVGALGGGGSVRNPAAFTNLPVFVGVGEKDFALRNSRALAKSLTDGGAKQVQLKEYPGVEHMVIVREALPDLFTQWDDLAK